MAAVSAALRAAALTPPVPSFAIAAIASADMVSVLGAVTPARTVAILVVLKTEAWAEASNESIMMDIAFMMAADRKNNGVSRICEDGGSWKSDGGKILTVYTRNRWSTSVSKWKWRLKIEDLDDLIR
jgi:hypothetical protein